MRILTIDMPIFSEILFYLSILGTESQLYDAK